MSSPQEQHWAILAKCSQPRFQLMWHRGILEIFFPYTSITEETAVKQRRKFPERHTHLHYLFLSESIDLFDPVYI